MQTIMRIGHWNLNTCQVDYLLTGLKPEGLLAYGMWPGAAQKEFGLYFSERFMVTVPMELVYLLMPWLKELEAKADVLYRAALNNGSSSKVLSSVQIMAKVMPYLAMVVVQDALELAEKFPDNPVHEILLQNAQFRYAPVVLLSTCMPAVHWCTCRLAFSTLVVSMSSAAIAGPPVVPAPSAAGLHYMHVMSSYVMSAAHL
jgi:hypothetical protein